MIIHFNWYCLKNLLTISILLLYISSSYGCAFSNEDKGYKKICCDKLCFTFEVPENWKKHRKYDSPFSLYFKEINVEIPKTRLFVGTMLPVPKTQTGKYKNINHAIAEMGKPSKHQGYNQVQKREERIIVIDGQEGYQITWSFKKKGVEFIRTETVFIAKSEKKSNGAVSFIIISLKKDMSRHKRVVDHIIESIKFNSDVEI